MNQINFKTGIIDLEGRGASVTKGDDMEGFTHVEFPEPFPDGSEVGVVPMTQTFHGPDTPGLRVAHVTTTGFKIRINELVSHGGHKPLSDGNHVKEKVAWIAFTKGATQGDPKHGGPGHGGPGHGHQWQGKLEANDEQGVKTGVTVSSGDVISITVTGSATLGKDHTDFYPYEGPNGMPNTAGDSHAIRPSANMGAVLMRIGDGKLRFVGSGLPNWKVPEGESGVITFLYNTNPVSYSTAAGSFDITLKY